MVRSEGNGKPNAALKRLNLKPRNTNCYPKSINFTYKNEQTYTVGLF